MANEMIHKKLAAYMTELVPERAAEMQAMEAYAEKHSFPIIGAACGYLCYQIARMIGARQVFELGSGYGYSTAWFAKAVQENGGGAVHHVVWDQELSDKAKKHLAALGYDGIVRYTVREAVQALRDAPGPFDLIFNDIDKEGYVASLEIVEQKLRPGGVLLTDNLIWSGRIFDKKDQTPATQGIREYTRLLTTSPRWATTIIPIRDGLGVAFKKS